VGDRHVAVMTDRKGEIAVVSIADGRIVSRIKLKHDRIDSLAASPDGKTFYYSTAGTIWSMPAAGGDPLKLATGDSVAADPNGRDLIVALTDKDSVRLTRVPIDGGAPQPIAMQGDLRMPNPNLTAGAVAPDGRILVFTASSSRWAYSLGVVDPRAGTISPIPHSFDGEVAIPLWAPDGRIVASGRDYNFTLWRFRPSAH
jgi:Tol biopolymer transport system component